MFNGKNLFKELSVLDDKGIKLYERCCKGPVLFESVDDRNILLYLCEQQIAEQGIIGDFNIRSECISMYENEVKGEAFEEYRKKSSWVWKCKRWCDDMYDYFPKAILLKLVNKKMPMSEEDMMKIFRKFPIASFNDDEYDDWIIPQSYFMDEDKIGAEIEAQEGAEFYLPSVEEIEEFSEKGYLFSKDSCQKVFKFLVELLGDENKAYDACNEMWFDIISDDLFDDTIKHVINLCPVVQNRKKEFTELVMKYYEDMENNEYNGYSIAYARQNGLKGKGKNRIRRGFME